MTARWAGPEHAELELDGGRKSLQRAGLRNLARPGHPLGGPGRCVFSLLPLSRPKCTEVMRSPGLLLVPRAGQGLRSHLAGTTRCTVHLPGVGNARVRGLFLLSRHARRGGAHHGH